MQQHLRNCPAQLRSRRASILAAGDLLDLPPIPHPLSIQVPFKYETFEQ